VGKKTIAPLVAKSLKAVCIGINELAEYGNSQSFSGEDVEVDTEALRRTISAKLSGKAVIYGHLLPHVLPKAKASNVFVLRCDPKILKKRLATRGYSRLKLTENVEAELIGLVSAESFQAFGKEKTFEIDTTESSSAQSARMIVSQIRNRTKPAARIDWVSDYDSGEKLRSLLHLGEV
jgi:adenylate kinase